MSDVSTRYLPGSRALDETGNRYGSWLVVEFAGFGERGSGKRSGRKAWFLCRCDCGTELKIVGADLRRGNTTRCRRCGAVAANQSHGHRSNGKVSPTYKSWRSMIERCTFPKAKAYDRYGAVGITVCQRWLCSFEDFLADMGERPAGHTIDREDPFGNYEPDNCRWATPKQQRANQRHNRPQRGSS